MKVKKEDMRLNPVEIEDASVGDMLHTIQHEAVILREKAPFESNSARIADDLANQADRARRLLGYVHPVDSSSPNIREHIVAISEKLDGLSNSVLGTCDEVLIIEQRCDLLRRILFGEATRLDKSRAHLD